jgi:hypothetical protein
MPYVSRTGPPVCPCAANTLVKATGYSLAVRRFAARAAELVKAVPPRLTPAKTVPSCRQLVDPPTSGVRLVPAIVLDIESDRRRRQPQRNRQGESLPPRRHHEYEKYIGCHKPTENERGLEVHLRTVAPRLFRPSKVLIDAPANRAMKSITDAELQLAGRRRSCRSIIAPVSLAFFLHWHRECPVIEGGG